MPDTALMPMLRTGDVMAFLNCSKPTAHKLFTRGDIPCLWVAGSRRVALSDLLDYCERSRHTPAPKNGGVA